MTRLEKFIKAMARRYAKRQKFKEEVDEIKYGKGGKRKMPTGKKLTIFLIGNLTLVEIYTLFIMYYLQDISALPVLITAVVGDVIALLIYQINVHLFGFLINYYKLTNLHKFIKTNNNNLFY